MRGSVAAILAAASLGVAGCSGDAGGAAAGDTAPLAVVHAAQSSIAAAGKSAGAPSHGARAVQQRRSALPPPSATATSAEPTPAGPPRPRTAPPARALPASSAPRLAAPACEQYAAALAGRFPPAVQARGSARALAVMTDSLAAALRGMPVEPPRASLPARERLDDARARLAHALKAGDDGAATAIARATAPRIAAYARALGIADCGAA